VNSHQHGLGALVFSVETHQGITEHGFRSFTACKVFPDFEMLCCVTNALATPAFLYRTNDIIDMMLLVSVIPAAYWS